MKSKIILAAAACIALVACGKTDDATEIGSNRHIIERFDVKTLPLGNGQHLNACRPNQFRTIKFDSAYVFRSAEEYLSETGKDTLFVDSLVASTVDFTRHSVIAATGIVAADVKDIEVSLYTFDGEYRLNVNVKANQTRTIATKWNLLVQTPLIPEGKTVTGTFTTDRPLCGVMPDHAYYNFRTTAVDVIYDIFARYQSMKPLMYMIVYKEEDRPRIIDAVNNDLYCAIADKYNISLPMNRWQNFENFPADMRYDILKDCVLSNVFAACPDAIQYVSECTLWENSYGPSFRFFEPAVTIPANFNRYLTDYIGGNIYPCDNATLKLWQFDRSKIHTIDLHQIIDNCYLYSQENYAIYGGSLNFIYSQSNILNPKKHVYE